MARKLSMERRAKFLKSALKLFVAQGVQHTSTAAIASEAGTAAGTLFLYFPTKQDLINELVLDIGREQAEYIQSLIQPTFSAYEYFWTIWNGSLDWFRRNSDAYRCFQQVRNSRLIDEKTVQESQKYFGYYFHAIQKGLSEGSLKPYPFELIGEMLYKELEAVMNLIDLQKDPERQDQYIELGFDVFWSGIQTRNEK